MNLIIDWKRHPASLPIDEDRGVPLSVGGDIRELIHLWEITCNLMNWMRHWDSNDCRRHARNYNNLSRYRSNYIILDGLEGIQEYIARDVNNIARVEDEGNIVSIEGNLFLYPPKKSHPLLLLLFIQSFVCHLTI